ncbi:MAG: hypothetical protein FJY29_03145 [Betaproteobacteria bacterium]|nr:hypothetical protein [Betaproteobacteria bacterium]
MAEKPSLKQILELYYALRAQGVQRFPQPRTPGGAQSDRTLRCLFLLDFNAQGSPSSVVGGDSVLPALLKRLLDRLPWRDFVDLHVVFDAPPKSPQLHPLDEKTLAPVMTALASERVGRCVCFGWRAAQVCAVALGIPFALPPEAFEPVQVTLEGDKAMEILILPDVRELEAFPEWRAKVWESLQTFGAAR